MTEKTEGSDKRRLGVFGGTFDPPHIAHVVLAATAMYQLQLDKLIVTVAGTPWQKVGTRPISDPMMRLQMAKLAFAPVERVVVSDIELRRSGNSYTVDTLAELADSETELFLVLGSDAAAGIDTWERPHDVAALATIAVFPRRGYESARPPDDFEWELLELPGLEVSSAEIRRRAGAGEPIAGLVPSSVQRLIEVERLYRE